MFVPYAFSLVWVAEWPPFGKELSIRLTLISHVFPLFVVLGIARFGFESKVSFYMSSS